MKLFTGIDLHSNNIFVVIIDYKKNSPNQPDIFLAGLKHSDDNHDAF